MPRSSRRQPNYGNVSGLITSEKVLERKPTFSLKNTTIFLFFLLNYSFLVGSRLNCSWRLKIWVEKYKNYTKHNCYKLAKMPPIKGFRLKPLSSSSLVASIPWRYPEFWVQGTRCSGKLSRRVEWRRCGLRTGLDKEVRTSRYVQVLQRPKDQSFHNSSWKSFQ